MRKFFPLIFLCICFICNNSYSQDLIVTNVGDSISCRVVEQTKDYIHFSYTRYNHTTIRELPSNYVKSVIMGYFLTKDSLDSIQREKVLADTLRNAGEAKNQFTAPDTNIQIFAADLAEVKLPRWQFGFNGGYAYRLFKPKIRSTSYELEYIDDLKSGYSLGAEAFYFPWRNMGLGFKYDRYMSNGERDIRTKDDITIQFIGASAAHRLTFKNNKTSVLTAFWLGYQPYRNAVRYIGQDYTLHARTMGWGVSVGLDQKLTRMVAINFTAACYMGSIYKYEKELKGKTTTINLTRDNFEDLSRAEITVGLKFLK